LRYDVAARLKADFPDLEIIVNGGVETLEAAEMHLQTFDGVMIGRAAYGNPFMLAEADARLFGGPSATLSREQILASYRPLIARWLAAGVPLKAITRHMTGLYHGQPGGRLWRRYLAEHAHRDGAGLEVIDAALSAVRAAAAAVEDSRAARAA
jgi:tRNA-dihydrouridine synthase A